MHVYSIHFPAPVGQEVQTYTRVICVNAWRVILDAFKIRSLVKFVRLLILKWI